MSRIITFFNKISTAPNKSSYYWRDSFSIISFIILNLIYIERCISLLQWIKFFYREANTSSKDPSSKRPNVPAQVVEIYYIFFCFAFVLVAGLSCSFPLVIRIAAWYFTIDSACWVLYYFFFRRFFEEKYAIMHTLEYIVLFPVVLLMQASCICIINKGSIPIGQGVKMLINPNTATPLPILFLSVIYVAVIFGLIISYLPLENIKERGDYRYHLLVIGFGDVVKHRLKPAIELQARIANAAKEEDPIIREKLEKRINKEKRNYLNIAYYDPLITERKEERHLNIREVCMPLKCNGGQEWDNFIKDALGSNIIWIATPPIAHMQYLGQFLPTGKFIVLEKPATIFRNEFILLNEWMKHEGGQVFFLSYYILEKALPLTFLYRPHSFFEKYLDFGDKSREEVQKIFASINRLKSISVSLLEKEDNRDWAFNPEYGGQYFETFIHPLSLCYLILGKLPKIDKWGELTFSESNDKGQPQRISYSRSTSALKIHLEIHKQSDESLQPKRMAHIAFSNHLLEMDMDKQILSIIKKSDQSILATISIKKDFLGKYAVQWDMVRRCYSDQLIPSDIDCRDIQFASLEWLFNNEGKQNK